jgi:hypothetical protein
LGLHGIGCEYQTERGGEEVRSEDTHHNSYPET